MEYNLTKSERTDMIYKLSVKIVEYLIKNGAGNEDNENVYVYGIELMIEKFITYTLLFFISIYLKMFFPSILFVVFFVLLRGYTGGYHANTYIGCLAGTMTLYLVGTQIVIPLMLFKETPLLLGLVITVVLILILSPINHPNLDMNYSEKMKCKKRARIVLALETVFILTEIIWGVDKVFIVFPLLGMVICAFLLVLAKIIKQEVIVYEEKCEKECVTSSSKNG